MTMEMQDVNDLAEIVALESVWRTGEEFLAKCDRSQDTLVFLHPVPEGQELPGEMTLGSLCRVTVRFLDRQAAFRVHAHVIQRSQSGDRRGLLLRLLHEEKARQELVLGCAQGRPLALIKRFHDRISCALPTQVEVGSEEYTATALDISEGGVRLAVEHPNLAKGASVNLRVDAPAPAPSLAAAGQVVYAEKVGPQPAVGIKFIFGSSDEREQLTQHVRALKAQFLGRPPTRLS